MTHRCCKLASILLLAVAGCSGGANVVPVSGVVRLDGKPYGKAVVTFQPVPSPEIPTPGRGSTGRTDENGRYVLVSDGTTKGATVGKHIVRITTRGGDDVKIAAEKGSSSDDPSKQKPPADPIPPEWHSKSAKEFAVPPGGTDKADFDITSVPPGKK
ncbi:hypothetical protein [Limnoglobus roseus]|uniref:Carboxypeptidase regulatory-like domain-containing protein n=1 Tax=Limnoglobus roseus TaxID=2598579 RepID=A0A5C1APK4_9BACT|nr:hypothetical protein [Limnoglobus roseus]QEL20063.1 carboxypeptidase regulatory-like domain-containing protein [Limnoglobus roseus]